MAKGVVTKVLNGYKGYGFIRDEIGEDYYFNYTLLADDDEYMDDYPVGTQVTFQISTSDKGKKAENVRRIENYAQIEIKKPKGKIEDKIEANKVDKVINSNPIIKESEVKTNSIVDRLAEDHGQYMSYYMPGFPQYLDKSHFERFFKPDTREDEIVNILSQILYISRIGSHTMNINSAYEFCVAGATEYLKQFIRGKFEFLIVMSWFPKKDWQEKTLVVEREIRKRAEIAQRRLLVNFYVLISNADDLIERINKVKGSTSAAIIPFTFNEILNSTKNSLHNLFTERFTEYYFENNMLGETSAIDDDNLLFGDRGKIADSIVARCLEKKNSGIFGLRRSGKTSVLNAVIRRLQRNGIKYVKIESRTALVNLDSWKSALFDIAQKIRESTLEFARNDNETREEYFKRLKLESTEEQYEKRASALFVEDVKSYCKKEETFVIAIDEIELITYNTATSDTWNNVTAYTAFWGALRDCGCSLIVCGVNSSINEINTINYNGQQGDNPMYGRIIVSDNFDHTYLPAFTDDQTKEMINRLGGYSNLDFTDVYADINRAFGGQPYAIRQFCSYVFENVKNYRKINELYKVKKSAVKQLLTKFLNSNEGNNLAEVILQHLQIFKEEYGMLKKFALSPEKYKTIEQEEIKLIDHLCKYGLIDYDYDTKYVAFKIELLKDYIQRRYQKDPKDMDNNERVRYVQETVKDYEINIKTYIYSFYKYNDKSKRQNCRNHFVSSIKRGDKNRIIKNPKYKDAINYSTIDFKEFFDHKKFIIYFSSLINIIVDFWDDLGDQFTDAGINQTELRYCLEKMNAGRTDADHYDAEDLSTIPENWTIDDKTMDDFTYAVNKLKPFIDFV